MTENAAHRRIALLVDAENMQPEYMGQILPQVVKLGRPIIQYAFADFSNPAAKPWVEFLRHNIIEARQVTPAESGKNAADFALVIEAMQLVLRDKCDALCIVSSDRDFVALTTFLKAEGIAAYGFGKASTGNKYRQSCARFYEVSAETAVQRTQPAAQTRPAVQNKPASLAKSVDTQAGPNLPVILQEIVRLADKDGWASLLDLGRELGKLEVRAKDSGSANWAKLFNSLDGFEVRKEESGQRSVRVVVPVKTAA